MNRKLKNSIIATATALVIVSAYPLSACSPQPEYEEEGLSVVFNYNDGVSRPYTVYAEENESVNEPTAPILAGYKFKGWQTKNDGTGTPVTFPLSVTEDTTVYAVWEAEKYNIIFDYNYGGKKEVVEKEYNTTLEEPEAPVREGYEFFYWQTAPDGGKEVKFPYTVKSETTFYANWATGALVRITLNYNYEGAESDGLVRLPQGEPLTAQDAGTPKRSGYVFKGWALDTEGKSMVSFPYTFTEHATIYAIWERETFTVSFMYNYPDPVQPAFSTQAVEGGSTVSAPEGVPTREGHMFVGWYPNAKGGTPIEFPLTVSRTTRIYAHWKADNINATIFDAELTEFAPDEIFPGYSGSAKGAEIVSLDDTDSAYTIEYPLNSKNTAHSNYYVTYLYKFGAKIKFVIYSDKDVSNVTLKASLAYEILTTGSLTIAPEGDFGYSFIVNGTPLNYRPITITGPNVGGAEFKSTFSEYTVATNVSLRAGENIIELVTNNENPAIGGTTAAVAPMVDYIKLEGNATFSWSPVYDNLYQ